MQWGGGTTVDALSGAFRAMVVADGTVLFITTPDT